MRGDFSRDSFDRLRHYSRVLQQQGRVELDADSNERQAIQLHLLRSLAKDLIGPSGGPDGAFSISSKTVDGDELKGNFSIAPGHYYVDGWLCENDKRDALYSTQPSLLDAPALSTGKRYLVYLDVWERHLCAAETDTLGEAERLSPTAMREVALGGPDTTTRTQVVWQVKVSDGEGVVALPTEPLPCEPRDSQKLCRWLSWFQPIWDFLKALWTVVRREQTNERVHEPGPTGWDKWMCDEWPKWVALWQSPQRGRLKVSSTQVRGQEDGYRAGHSVYQGVENQLYRIEIHRGGKADGKGAPSFVWSRENGSVTFTISQIDGKIVTLAAYRADAKLGISVGDCVEITDDRAVLENKPGVLCRVIKVNSANFTVELDRNPDFSVDFSYHPVLRRWDSDASKAGGSVSVKPAEEVEIKLIENQELHIEDGISVYFEKSSTDVFECYRTGDYWLIPARTVVGDVLWPRDGDKPIAMPPRGVEHHYAPLAVLSVAQSGTVSVADCPRGRFRSLSDVNRK